MPPEIDLFAAPKGTVTAPAGCGKTQLITITLKETTEEKPVLVLTHTNAGKSALEARLAKASVPKAKYRVSTIDSWAIRMISRFPMRSELDPAVVRLENTKEDYPAIRLAAIKLLKSGAVSDALKATYSRLIVDEYQDCTLPQHYLIGWTSRVLPTYLLGDPLQSIFDFNEKTVNWQDNVLKHFPSLGTLNTPWRWKNANAEPLGNWLLAVREELQAGRPLDLKTAPEQVSWFQLPSNRAELEDARLEAAKIRGDNDNESVVVIGGKYPDSHQYVASNTPGVTTVEAVDLKDLTLFGRTFDPAAKDALHNLLAFATKLMANLGVSELLRRLDALTSGKARKEASPAETALLEFMATPSIESALSVICAFEATETVRVYRPDVLNVCKAAMALAVQGGVTFYEAVVAARERNRHLGRPIAQRAVGSTLLLKGLEADVAVILNADDMTARNLYVAITRGAKKLVICSQSQIIRPKPR